MSKEKCGLLTNTPTNPDPNTGTRRVDLWREDATGGTYGDRAVGYACSERYVSDDGYGCADVGTFVEFIDDGDGFPYVITEMTTSGRAVLEDGVIRPADDADIDYEAVGGQAFETLEGAQAECDRVGQIDYSFAIYLRRSS